MERIISPPLTELSRLRTPLTAGEQKVLDFFIKNLPIKWEIYVQPHLNGLRPDFVLLNPDVGIAVFEVKDWNFKAMRYENREGELWASKDGKDFSLCKQNPIAKIRLYKSEIFNIYCPRLGENGESNRKAWSVVTAGVIFPFESSYNVKNFMGTFFTKEEKCYPQYNPISGMEDLVGNSITAVFPEALRSSSIFMDETYAQDLRGWLTEPKVSATQREPLPLDKQQKELASTRTQSGYRRIKGPAGSGKTLVLAARASRLASEEKHVLISTFNITLINYIKDLISRDIQHPIYKDNIELVHFHMWCKRICYTNGCDKKYDAIISEKISINEKLIRIESLTKEIIESSFGEIYDAIFVDEAQDFHPQWWNIIRKSCKNEGEKILIADATQDIYGTAHAWTEEAMSGMGFRGDWAQLSVSYRMPPKALNIARHFAQNFLSKETTDLPTEENNSLVEYPCALTWVQCTDDNILPSFEKVLYSMMKTTGNKTKVANADITILVENVSDGKKLVNFLSTKGIKTANTFSDDAMEQRRQKIGFYQGDARIKATTIHSFKGWESNMLIMYVTNAWGAKNHALIYTGLTRVKRDLRGSWLTVVCSDSSLQEYGKTWPSYEENIPLGICPF